MRHLVLVVACVLALPQVATPAPTSRPSSCSDLAKREAALVAREAAVAKREAEANATVERMLERQRQEVENLKRQHQNYIDRKL